MSKLYIANFPKADYTTFHGRLNFILSRAGFSTEVQKITQLSKYSGCTKRTVKRWLIGQSLPKDWFIFFDFLESIDYRECFNWLFYGKSESSTNLKLGRLDPWEKDIARSMASMSEWQKRQLLRMSIRMLNKDKKVERLMAQRDAGLISRDHFFSLM